MLQPGERFWMLLNKPGRAFLGLSSQWGIIICTRTKTKEILGVMKQKLQ